MVNHKVVGGVGVILTGFIFVSLVRVLSGNDPGFHTLSEDNLRALIQKNNAPSARAAAAGTRGTGGQTTSGSVPASVFLAPSHPRTPAATPPFAAYDRGSYTIPLQSNTAAHQYVPMSQGLTLHEISQLPPAEAIERIRALQALHSLGLQVKMSTKESNAAQDADDASSQQSRAVKYTAQGGVDASHDMSAVDSTAHQVVGRIYNPDGSDAAELAAKQLAAARLYDVPISPRAIINAAAAAKPHSHLGGVPDPFERMYNTTFNYTKNRGFDGGIPMSERYYEVPGERGTPEWERAYDEYQVKERLYNRLMDFTKQPAQREVMTWMWRGDFEFYWELGKAMRPHSIVVEVGCFQGGSVIALATSLVYHKIENVTIVAYDIWPGWERGYPPGVTNTQKIFDDNMKKFGFDHMVRSVKIPRDRLDTATLHGWPNESVDVVYIDDGHHFDDVMHDLTTWYRVVKPGGVLAGHDWDAIYHGGVVKAVKAFCKASRCTIAPWKDSGRRWAKNSIIYNIVRDGFEEPAKSLVGNHTCQPWPPEQPTPGLKLCL